MACTSWHFPDEVALTVNPMHEAFLTAMLATILISEQP